MSDDEASQLVFTELLMGPDSYSRSFEDLPLRVSRVFDEDDERKRIVYYAVEIEGEADVFVWGVMRILHQMSWMNELVQDCDMEDVYRLNAQKTIRAIDRAMKQAKADPDNEDGLAAEFRELAVSFCSQAALRMKRAVRVVPLAELLKEKVRGNPGFDFHAIERNGVAIFGEAKYRRAGRGYAEALKQAAGFVREKKQVSDMAVLRDFASRDTLEMLRRGRFEIGIGFSTAGVNQRACKDSLVTMRRRDTLLPGKMLLAIGIHHDEIF